ncbi:MAG: hypothetical protein KatS3mg111_1051 [Pirellulaceae bacterium]|nr:MAG: hypothetical protein KatS3mg111_1051 [Pirellulaceae bacterium]
MPSPGTESRRQFLRGSSLLLASTLPSHPSRVRLPQRIGLWGCDRRGIALLSEALRMTPEARVVALADESQSRLQQAVRNLKGRFSRQFDVGADGRILIGTEAVPRFVAAQCDAVIILPGEHGGGGPLHQLEHSGARAYQEWPLFVPSLAAAARCLPACVDGSPSCCVNPFGPLFSLAVEVERRTAGWPRAHRQPQRLILYGELQSPGHGPAHSSIAARASFPVRPAGGGTKPQADESGDTPCYPAAMAIAARLVGATPLHLRTMNGAEIALAIRTAASCSSGEANQLAAGARGWCLEFADQRFAELVFPHPLLRRPLVANVAWVNSEHHTRFRIPIAYTAVGSRQSPVPENNPFYQPPLHAWLNGNGHVLHAAHQTAAACQALLPSSSPIGRRLEDLAHGK